MTSVQPAWKFVANLGDMNPLDYGGLFVYVDTTGIYTPQAEKLVLDEPDNLNSTYTVYRFCLEPCTYINRILSDNKFHPDYPAWFAMPERERKGSPQESTYLKDLAAYVGVTVQELAKWFCSNDVCQRARAWEIVGEYHGFENLDGYPLKLFRSEAKK